MGPGRSQEISTGAANTTGEILGGSTVPSIDGRCPTLWPR